MKKGVVALLVLVLASTMVFAQGAPEGADDQTKIGVSIMELSADTWYLGVIDGCEQ